MFGSQVLEVMIGLLLIYLTLSVTCSAIKEIIANLFALRSKTLEAGIRNLLQDDRGGLAEKILEHPLVSASAAPGKKLPSYISSRNFAMALFDVVAPATAQPRTFQDLRAGIAGLPGTKLRKSLLGSIDSAQGDLEIALIKIERWFDDHMERVSGWYKQRAQKLIFGVGFLLCVAMNADTFQIARELWSDQALRSTLAAQATERVRQTSALRPAPGGSTNASAPDVGSISDQLRELGEDVRAAQPLPLGWGGGANSVPGILASWPSGVFKLLGILVSSFAILMGAPFWFDLLNTIINLRISGDPPAPSR